MAPLVVDGVRKGIVRNLLGPDPDDGTNQMEIRGLIAGHRADAEYQFDRTIEMKEWYLAGKMWKLWQEEPVGSNDNTHNKDEDDHPDNDHIYSIDGPGFTFSVTQPTFDNIPLDDRSSVTELVYMKTAFRSGNQCCSNSASRRPLVFGITTSVRSNWTFP